MGGSPPILTTGLDHTSSLILTIDLTSNFGGSELHYPHHD